MKTMTQVRTENGYDTFIRSIVNAIGRDNLEDIMNHGADCGYPGITYTADCMDIAWRNKATIRTLIERDADDCDLDVGKMLQSWKCIGSDFTIHEIVRSLYQNHRPRWESDVDRVVWNGLAWYAAETVARWFCEDN
jgi:hypothetical protein